MRRVDQRTHPWAGHLRPGGVRGSGHHQLGHLVESDSTVAAGVSACGYSVAPQPHRGTPPAFVRPNLNRGPPLRWRPGRIVNFGTSVGTPVGFDMRTFYRKGTRLLGHPVEGDSTVAAGVSACGYSVAPQPHRGTPPAFVRPNLKQNCVCGGPELGESRQACRSRRRNVNGPLQRCSATSRWPLACSDRRRSSARVRPTRPTSGSTGSRCSVSCSPTRTADGSGTLLSRHGPDLHALVGRCSLGADPI